MNGREIRIILRKELVDSLRDKRTWRYSIVLPLLLVPLLMVATSMGVTSQSKALTEEWVPLAVAGSEHGPALVSFLEESKDFRVIAVADGRAALSDRTARVSLVVAPGFDDAMLDGDPSGLQVYFDGTDTTAAMLMERLTRTLQGYNHALVAARLQQRGVDVQILRPFELTVSDVAAETQKRAGLLALMLPMLLALWGAAGGMHVAVDVTAGEKERGTLEALLAAPVSRFSLVMGKYLTVLLAAVFAQVVSLVGFAVGFWLKAFLSDDAAMGGLSLTWQTAGGLLLVAVVLSAIFAAVELALCLQSRSIREAQSYQAPISFGAMLPGLMVAFVAPADIPGFMYCVPLVNNVVLFKELILGIFRPEHLILTVATGGVVAWLALRWAARRFRQEGALFRGV